MPNTSSLFDFNRQFEQSLAILDQTPWLVLRLKQLIELCQSLEGFLDRHQTQPFRLELESVAKNLISELADEGADANAVDPKDLLSFYGQFRETFEDKNLQELEYLIIEKLFRLGASIRLTGFLGNCSWFSETEDDNQGLVAPDLLSFQRDFLKVYGSGCPANLRGRLETQLDYQKHGSSHSQIKGLFFVTGGDAQSGLLANLSLENLRCFKKPGSDQLRIATHLVDENDVLADQGHELFNWLRSSFPNRMQGHLRLEYTLSEKSSVLSGSSIGLGMAALAQMAFYSLDNNRAFEPRIYDDVAVTGALDMAGNVKSVNPTSLKHKVEAAFFSSIQTLVLPVQHREEAKQFLAELNANYPLRQLRMVFLSHIDDLENYREIFFYQRRKVSQRIRQFFSKYANFVTVSIMLFILALGTGFWFGVVKHPIPREAETMGEIIKIKNRYGFTLWYSEAGANHYKIQDLDSDGQFEVLINYHRKAQQLLKGQLVCYDHRGNIMWQFDAGDSVRYGDMIYDDYFGFDYLYVDDFDKDGLSEVCGYSSQGWFPNRLVVLSNRGNLLSEYWNAGGFAEMATVEVFSGNENRELAITGRNNEYRSGILLIIDPLRTRGISPQTKSSYIKVDSKAGNELYYVKFPYTHYIKTGKRDETKQVLFNENGNIRVLLTTENQQKGSVYYTFNKKMEVVFTALDDNYFKNYKLLFPDEEPLDSDNPAFLSSFRKVEYWNGKNWELIPTPVIYINN
ncbi:hypothetical protein HQ531_14660 [bacterium]|nr:hypothetical protein [bacterium]